MRKPNEVLISTVCLEKMLALGNENRPFRVIKGPDPEARIINAHAESELGMVTLVYDRPVDEPVLQEIEWPPFRVSWSEELIEDKDVDIRSIVLGPKLPTPGQPLMKEAAKPVPRSGVAPAHPPSPPKSIDPDTIHKGA